MGQPPAQKVYLLIYRSVGIIKLPARSVSGLLSRKDQKLMKAAVVVLSDPQSGGEEALGRVFNALAAAYEFKQRGDDVTVILQGAGTRWAGELTKPGHPAARLFEAVRDKVAGVSCGCAEVFGATSDAKQAGLNLIADNRVPSTPGITSFRGLIQQGYTVMTF
jgi:hypothetical protein